MMKFLLSLWQTCRKGTEKLFHKIGKSVGKFFAFLRRLYEKYRPPIALTERVWLWLFLLFVTLLFAQSLKLPLSYTTFLLVLLLPIVTAVTFLCAAIFLSGTVHTDRESVEKESPLSVTVLLSNDSILPFPFVEMVMLLPDRRGVRCETKKIGLSVAPRSDCELTKTATFRFRGNYEVGIREIWVYDYLRMVKFRVRCRHYANVFVMPRRLTLPPKPLRSDSDEMTHSVLRVHGADKTESSDIRMYEPGDSLKSIHWKLSTKSEDLIVRDPSRNFGSNVCIMADFMPHYAFDAEDEEKSELPTPLSEYADMMDALNADLTVEYTLAVLRRELDAGNTVTVMWLEPKKTQDFGYGSLYDTSRKKTAEEVDTYTPCSMTLYSPNDLGGFFRRFAAVPLLAKKNQFQCLSSLIDKGSEASLICVSAAIDTETTAALTRLSRSTDIGTKSEFVFCRDSSLITATDDREPERLAMIQSVMTLTKTEAAEMRGIV